MTLPTAPAPSSIARMASSAAASGKRWVIIGDGSTSPASSQPMTSWKSSAVESAENVTVSPLVASALRSTSSGRSK
jgi:hypothetical protein